MCVPVEYVHVRVCVCLSVCVCVCVCGGIVMVACVCVCVCCVYHVCCWYGLLVQNIHNQHYIVCIHSLLCVAATSPVSPACPEPVFGAATSPIPMETALVSTKGKHQ